jgi:hypothetical protein
VPIRYRTRCTGRCRSSLRGAICGYGALGGWIERAATGEDGHRIPLPEDHPAESCLAYVRKAAISFHGTLRWHPNTHAYHPINTVSWSIRRSCLRAHQAGYVATVR